MSSAPHFWSTPFRYCRWAAVEKPALFWSVIIGGIGPVMIYPIRSLRYNVLNDPDPPAIPNTYPVPSGPRKQLTGYDDE
ncbi:NADH-ubiquinone oxidoreductase 9.5 kDa subunit-like protein [Emericellopsis cladophorae]|uniref:NADH-ubiquinone oxidoreductase 9.5 kDa subunit-like protein n=1 Tax=Emericellopsis cladophorae TaxID=2686198 RepID=A0A9Q0BES4_9HYPO|nr:NADH-ubiquinone oxidoreductase 9.5 kDa subunit-like protein [Emericellopsis cladophorae]KAI6781910.1 NADH-ubiquinone oxidoreductase 9.5 kDa subunit-like protein [Emericellopsis cladophorae]